MEIDLVTENDIAFVELTEELDFFHSSKFKEYFKTLFESKVRGIIIDFQGVTYIDSSGIGALLTVFKESKVRNMAFLFINIHGSVRKVIELTKLDGYLPIFQGKEEAIAHIGSME